MNLDDVFGIRSVDNVMQVFHKTIRQLEGIKDQHTDRVARKQLEIQSLNMDIKSSEEEVQKAATVLSWLNRIVGGEAFPTTRT